MAKPTDMQHELNGKTIHLAPMSPIAFGFHVFNDPGMPYLFYREKGGGGRYYLPPEGNWKFFATTDNITEEQAAELVECFGRGRWRNYAFISQYSELLLPTAKESFQSWLTANGISANNACLIRIFYES